MSDPVDVEYRHTRTPDHVVEAVERAQERRRDEPRPPRPTTSERERFFANLAEHVKRAESG